MNNDFIRWLLDLERIPADAEDVRLAWEYAVPAWVWVVVLFALGFFAIWSYSRLVGDRRGRGVLAGVRAMLLLLLVLVLAGPMLELPRETIEEDWVIVLVDRSESMQIADAPPADRRRAREAQLRAALDASRDTWRGLDDKRHLLWLGFHDGVFDLGAPEEGDPGDRAADRIVDLGDPTGSRTNLDASIEQALQRAAARPISGIVVLTDGRTSTPPARSLVRRLQADAIQVFAVPLGSAEPIGDLAVRRIDAPRRAFVRDKVPVIVELDRFGSAVREQGATIRLIDEGTGETLDSAEFDPQNEQSAVTLTAEPSVAGEATWRVEIETARADLIPDNNVKLFPIELIDRPLRVLYVDGYPRWEFRYLRWLLIREKSLESSIMLLSADRDFAQEGNTPITRMPRSPEEFAQFDVIILGDVAGTFFSPSQLEMIRDHVAERGAGLLWIGGERGTPGSFVGSAAALADLLPVRGSLSLAPIGRPVNMTPTPLAERLGVLRLIADGRVGWPQSLIDPAAGWSQIWWAQRIEPNQLKPTAQALAVTAEPVGAAQLPLVIHMRYGSGQTIYVATDEIWRWRYGRGDLLPEQFWLQMIRMLGRETLAGGDVPAVLEIEPRRSEVRQPVQIRLRLIDAKLAGLELPAIQAAFEDDGGRKLSDVELRRSAPDDPEYVATLLPDQTGQFRIRVDDPLVAGGTPLVAELEVFSPENELRRPETDHALLASLASETDGRVLSPDELDRLPDLLPNRSVRTPNPLTERIWDTPLVFILVLLLLTGEWIGRKILRLA